MLNNFHKISEISNWNKRAFPVQNKIFWKNPKDNLLIGEIENKSSNIPIVLCPDDSENQLEEYGYVAIRNRHGRSHDLPDVIAENGVTYSLDVKGGALVKNGQHVKSIYYRPWQKYDKEYVKLSGRFGRGVCQLEVCIYDRDKTLKILEKGGFCHQPTEIIILEEVFYKFPSDSKSNLYKVAYLKECGVIPENVTLCAYVRKAECKTRIWDIEKNDSKSKTEIEKVIENFRKIFKRDVSVDDYLKIFTERVSKTIKIIHELGDCHGMLHLGNFTLAGEIVDNDSNDGIENFKPGEVDKEIFYVKEAIKSIRALCTNLFPNQVSISEEGLFEIFEQNYLRKSQY